MGKKKKSRMMLMAMVGCQLSLVGVIDYLTGYEVHMGALYAAIVAFAAWNIGTLLGILTAVAATAVIFWTERASGLVYSHAWTAYTNSLSRLGIYLIIVWGFNRLRGTLDLAERRVEAFDRTLPICACCYRVDGGDGFWVDFPTYLRKNSSSQPAYRTCPICVDAVKATAPTGVDGDASVS